MGFYTFSQNNSGGVFDIDDNIREWVIIEGNDMNEILDRANDIGIYFDGMSKGIDCSCCGDRWYWPQGGIGDEPVMYYQRVATHPFKYANVVIHYKDGTKQYAKWSSKW
jgi:hypothetical protein